MTNQNEESSELLGSGIMQQIEELNLAAPDPALENIVIQNAIELPYYKEDDIEYDEFVATVIQDKYKDYKVVSRDTDENFQFGDSCPFLIESDYENVEHRFRLAARIMGSQEGKTIKLPRIDISGANLSDVIKKGLAAWHIEYHG